MGRRKAMSTSNEKAMRLALEALNFEDSGDPECEHGFMYDKCPNDKCDKRRFKDAIKALEAALEAHEALAEQEPDDLMIAYMSGLHDGKKLVDRGHKPCQTCEALARTVMLDQSSHDTTPQRSYK
jgi:hypothetical protein